MEKIDVFDVQIPDGRQIRCISYNKVTDKEASFANLVRDRYDDDKFAILWNFSSDDDLIMRNICHESFHIAMSVCQFCNMSLGFKVGEDEHAAYIAGFAGDCVSEFINSKNTD